MMQLCLENRGGNPKTNPGAFLFSLGIQSCLVAILMTSGATQGLTNPATKLTIITPPPVFKPLPIKTAQSGGGGQHSPLPPIKGELPKPAPKSIRPAPRHHRASRSGDGRIADRSSRRVGCTDFGNRKSARRIHGRAGGLGAATADSATALVEPVSVTTPERERTSAFSLSAMASLTPEPISRIEPEYSCEEARKAKYSGTVLLSFVVNTDGTTSDFHVERSLRHGPRSESHSRLLGNGAFDPAPAKAFRFGYARRLL